VSEISDAVAVVVSEQTGQISVAHNGRMIRRLDAARLATILRAFLPAQRGVRAGWRGWLGRARSAIAPDSAKRPPFSSTDDGELEESLR
jgi:diadenylate cyclase